MKNIIKARQARIYGRYSSIPQEKGDSKRRQIDGAREYAAKNGITIIGDAYFDEGVSGKAGLNLEREFGRLLREAKQGEIILVELMDRLGRNNPFVLSNLIYQTVQKGIEIILWQENKIINVENIEDLGTQFSIFTGAAIGHQDNQRKMFRLRETFKVSIEQAKKGIPTKNLKKCLPELFRWNDTTKAFEANEATSFIIQRIFNEYNSGKGKTTIAQGLNKDSVPTLYKANKQTIGSVKPWLETSIKKILSNKAYNGTVTINGESYEGLIPKIVSDAVYNKAQMMAERNRNRSGNTGAGTRTNNLFPSIAFCKACGGTINVNICRNKSNSKPFYFYRCKNARLKTCKHEHIMIDARSVEYAFFDTFFGNGVQSLLKNDNRKVELNEKIAICQTRLDTITKAIDNLYVLVEAGDKEAGNRIAKRRDEQATIERELIVLQAKLTEDGEFYTGSSIVTEMLNNIELQDAYAEEKGIFNNRNYLRHKEIVQGHINRFFPKFEAALTIPDNRKKLSTVLPTLFSRVEIDFINYTGEAFNKDGKSIGKFEIKRTERRRVTFPEGQFDIGEAIKLNIGYHPEAVKNALRKAGYTKDKNGIYHKPE